MSKMVNDKKVFAYIIDSINPDDYDVVANTDKEKLQFVYDTFKSEMGHLIPQVGKVNAFREWLQGLPTAMDIEYQNHKILEIAYEWGSLLKNATEDQEDKILDNWFNFIANKTFVLMRKHKVNMD